MLSLTCRKKFGALVAQAWADPALRLRYERSPAQVLAEYGVAVDVADDMPTLPENPLDDLRDEELQAVYGATPAATCSTASSFSCDSCMVSFACIACSPCP